MLQYIEKMPKIDLHCHLDGSLSKGTIRQLAQNAGISVPLDSAHLKKLITAGNDCRNLVQYLSCFEIPLACLQTQENLFIAAENLLSDVANENVLYIEVRFAPLLSTARGLTADQVVDSVLQGLKAGQRRFGVDAALILCAMRHQSYEENSQLITIAERYLGEGVVALDLAGDEKAFPVGNHKPLFRLAHSRKIPFTIHAGEAAGASSVWAALSFGARRIGHGIAAQQDPVLMQRCADTGVGIEMCPTSNLQTKAIASWSDYPYQRFLAQGMQITINTDNRTVSNTSLTREFCELHSQYELDKCSIERLFRTAVEVSFTTDRQKKLLHAAFDAFKTDV